MTFLAINAQPNFCKRDRKVYQKRCFSTQRCIMGAIEMYNMDHSEMLNEYNPRVYDLLLHEKYIKEENIDTDCKYLVEGDLTEDGYIYCLNHGACGGQKEGTNIGASTKSKAQKKEEYTKALIFIALCFGPTFIYYFISFM